MNGLKTFSFRSDERPTIMKFLSFMITLGYFYFHLSQGHWSLGMGNRYCAPNGKQSEIDSATIY